MRKQTEEKYDLLNEAVTDVYKMVNKAEKAYNNTIKKAEKVFISNLYAALNKAETEADFDTISTATDDYTRDAFLVGDWDNLNNAIQTKARTSNVDNLIKSLGLKHTIK